MMLPLQRSIVIVCAMVTYSSTMRAATYDASMPPRAQDVYENARYRLWIPDDVKTVRAVIVRQHGCGEGARKFGLEHADDLQWQALARRWGCALMGSQLWAPEEDCSTWTMPDDGSAHAFHQALDHFASESKHPEIAAAPWCLWGHSGGAIWVTNMTYRYPERVVATFPRSGGLATPGRTFARSQPATPESNPLAFAVPMLFCYGANEAVEGTRFHAGVQGVHNVYDIGRKHDAVWAVAVHPNSDHENSNSRLLAIRFFDVMLGLRLPPANDGGAKPILRPLDFKAGYLCDAHTFAIERADQRTGDDAKCGWLATEPLALAWQEFSKSGMIIDKTAPPAPTDARLSLDNGAVVLTWNATADMESGLARFRILRNGEEIGVVGGPKIPRFNEQGWFRAWNYSDQPLPDTNPPEMRFEDVSAARDAAALYEVIAVNTAGIDSLPAVAKSTLGAD